MFDAKKYQEVFSEIHAPKDMVSKINNEIQKESKKYKSKALRVAVACIAILLIPAGTVYAYNYLKSALIYHEGKVELIEPAIQVVDETIQEEKYIIHVDSVLSDAHSTIVGLTLEAKSDKAKEDLNSQEFDIREIIRFDYEVANTTPVSMTCVSADVADNDAMRSFAIRFDGIEVPNTLSIYLEGQIDDAIALGIESQIDDLSVIAKPLEENTDYFIQSCNLNATRVEFEVTFAEPIQGDKIIEIYFRMADGSLKTLPQLAGNTAERMCWLVTDATPNTYRYTENFETLIEPLSVRSVVMNGMEYSFFDDEYAVAVEIPDSMRPFTTPFVEMDEVFYFYASDVCERIGASMESEGEKYIINYLGKTIEFRLNDDKILVDGEEQILIAGATFNGQDLVLPRDFFSILGVRDTMYFPQRGGSVQAPDSWLVTP